MQIGEYNITQDQMPSYIKPQDQPYHLYLSMQDIYSASQLGVMNNQMAQQEQGPINLGSAEARNSSWN